MLCRKEPRQGRGRKGGNERIVGRSRDGQERDRGGAGKGRSRKGRGVGRIGAGEG